MTGSPDLAMGSPAARGVLAATILGSGVASLDATVVNVALPRIGAQASTSSRGALSGDGGRWRTCSKLTGSFSVITYLVAAGSLLAVRSLRTTSSGRYHSYEVGGWS